VTSSRWVEECKVRHVLGSDVIKVGGAVVSSDVVRVKRFEKNQQPKRRVCRIG
jgi:hypothetical protein